MIEAVRRFERTMDLKLKRAAVLVLAVILTLGMTGCVGNLYDIAGSVNGTELSSGFYLMMQYEAYTQARMSDDYDSSKDLLKQKIEGKSAKSWVLDKTEEFAREYVYVTDKCRELDITLDDNGVQSVSQMMQVYMYWPENYAENGISLLTLERFYTGQQLKNQLMQHMYAEGGELAVADEQLKEEYGQEYAHIRSISIPLTSSVDGEDVQDQVLQAIDGLHQKLEGGMTLDEVAENQLEPVYELMKRDFDPTTAVDGIYSTYIDYHPDNFDTYSEDFLYSLQQQKEGEFGYYNMGSNAILYQKLKTFETDEEFEDRRTTVVSDLKSDEFEEYIKETYQQYPVSWRLFARSYLSPSKVVLPY